MGEIARSLIFRSFMLAGADHLKKSFVNLDEAKLGGASQKNILRQRLEIRR